MVYPAPDTSPRCAPKTKEKPAGVNRPAISVARYITDSRVTDCASAGLARAAVADGIFQKEPAIGDGCQFREVTVRNVGRIAGALCVAIHTRIGKLFEPPGTKCGADPSPKLHPDFVLQSERCFFAAREPTKDNRSGSKRERRSPHCRDVRSISTTYPQGRFLGCVSVHMGLLRNRSQRREKPAGVNRRACW